MHIGKSKAYWSTINPHTISLLTNELPVDLVNRGGVTLIGAPIGSVYFVKHELLAKLDECKALLSQIADISEARITFHFHRVCGSACLVQHLFRLVPPDVSHTFATQFDKNHMLAYSRFNNVPLSPSAH